jgi:hypothetical protein
LGGHRGLRARAKYIEDCIADPNEFRTLTLRCIGEFFDVAAYWTHFLYENKPDGQEAFDALLELFITAAQENARELTSHWLPGHHPQKFHSTVATFYRRGDFTGTLN